MIKLHGYTHRLTDSLTDLYKCLGTSRYHSPIKHITYIYKALDLNFSGKSKKLTFLHWFQNGSN